MSIPTPRVDVIMAVHNGLPYVDATLASLAKQTEQDWRLIVVDDASTDGTPELLDRWAERDSRILVIRNETNLGSGASRNRAIDMCTARYVAVQDADDMSLPTRLDEQCSFLDKEQDCDVVSSWVAEFGEWGGPVTRPWPTERATLDKLLCSGRMPMLHCATMFRREALEGAGGYDERCRRAQDLAAMLRMGPLGRMAIMPTVHVLYRHDRPERYKAAIRNGRGRALAIRLNPEHVARTAQRLAANNTLTDLRTTAAWLNKRLRRLEVGETEMKYLAYQHECEGSGCDTNQ